MRVDVMNYIKEELKISPKLNISSIARRFNCNRRTVKKYIESGGDKPIPKVPLIRRASLLDDYKELIKSKYTLGCTAWSIYEFIKKQGYKGKYGLVKNFCNQYKKENIKKATVRFETTPGLQAQVDWKESVVLHNRAGTEFKINVFILLLGYSRYKFLKLTTDRTRDTVFRALTEGFEYFGGVPREILFDNMRSVVDQSRTQFSTAVFNPTFVSFAKDAQFKPLACMAYRPQTKGKVEAVAHILNRLKVFDYEFDS